MYLWLKASLRSPGSVVAGAEVLWASPVWAGVVTWGAERWDTEHPTEMLAQAAHTWGATRGYWCFVFVLVMGSICIMSTNKTRLEAKVLPLSMMKKFHLYSSFTPYWNGGYFSGTHKRKAEMQGSVPRGVMGIKIWGGKGRCITGVEALRCQLGEFAKRKGL